MPVLGPIPAPPPPPAPDAHQPLGWRAPPQRRRPPPPPTALPPLEIRYKLIGYCDNLKPSNTSMNEFILVDRAIRIFENSSGCMMRRDPT